MVIAAIGIDKGRGGQAVDIFNIRISGRPCCKMLTKNIECIIIKNGSTPIKLVKSE
jgi:hypothetical protein